MDESLLKAVSQHMNVPEGLISRSAQARAEANGTDIDDVLNAWLGGASVDVKEISPKVQEPIQEEVEQIIEEVSSTRITERGATRADDRVSEAAMEDRKKEGYF